MLEGEYTASIAQAERLRACLVEQFTALIEQNSIALAVPLEARVKSISSILEKAERRARGVRHIDDVHDLVGLRLILLFRSDVEKMDRVLRGAVDVLSVEDTAQRLSETQFGYQSNHYILKIPENWAAIPSFHRLNTMVAEVQVRTMAQHMWAAASHKLQYKHEKSVPPPLRRTIHRVSALLETVDLEFGRVLEERRRYAEALQAQDETLNVDSLARILEECLPAENRAETEDYDEVLSELAEAGITTSSELRLLIEGGRARALSLESDRLDSVDEADLEDSGDRIARGVFFTHCGLLRLIMPNWRT